MRAILASAALTDDDTDSPALIDSNPARLTARTVNGRNAAAAIARKPRTPIQPATLEELAAIMDAMPERYRAMVLLAAWSPRFGELTELRRKDLTIKRDQQGVPTLGVLHIVSAVVWPEPDRPVVKLPKTDAGIRDVAIPPHLLPMILEHLDRWAEPGPEGPVLPAVESGGQMKRLQKSAGKSSVGCGCFT